MLKTNSKKVHANVLAYIRQDIDYLQELADESSEAKRNLSDDTQLCAFIWDIFEVEKHHNFSVNMNYRSLFEEWAQGLALGGLFCYYCSRSAVEDLGRILEAPEEVRQKYTEDQARSKLTNLIFRVVCAEKRKPGFQF